MMCRTETYDIISFIIFSIFKASLRTYMGSFKN